MNYQVKKRLLFILNLKYARELSPKIRHKIWKQIEEVEKE